MQATSRVSRASLHVSGETLILQKQAHEMQARQRRIRPHCLAIPGKGSLEHFARTVRSDNGYIDETDRLLVRPTPGSCDTGDADANVALQDLADALGEGKRHLSRDGSVLRDHRRRNTIRWMGSPSAMARVSRLERAGAKGLSAANIPVTVFSSAGHAARRSK